MGAEIAAGIATIVLVAVFLSFLLAGSALGAVAQGLRGLFKGAGYGAAGFAALVFCFLLLSGLYDSWRSASTRSQLKLEQQAIDVCRQELSKFDSPIKVSSLVDSDGQLDVGEVETLLRAGIQFLELPAKWRKKRFDDKGESWGAWTRSGDETLLRPMGQTKTHLRLSISPGNSQDCWDSLFGVSRLTTSPPFHPGTCLRAEEVDHSTASHRLASLPSETHKELAKWSIVERLTEKPVAALTHANTPGSPKRQSGRDDADIAKTVDGVNVDCRLPFSSLVALVRPQSRPSTSLMFIETEVRPSLSIADLTANFDDLVPIRGPFKFDKLTRKDFDFGGWEWNRLVNGDPWPNALGNAKAMGWSALHHRRIDSTRGEISTLKFLSRENTGRAIPHEGGFFWAGFAPPAPPKRQYVLANIGLDGTILWRKSILLPEEIKAPWLNAIDLADHELHLYFDMRGVDDSTSGSFRLHIPLPKKVVRRTNGVRHQLN